MLQMVKVLADANFPAHRISKDCPGGLINCDGKLCGALVCTRVGLFVCSMLFVRACICLPTRLSLCQSVSACLCVWRDGYVC